MTRLVLTLVLGATVSVSLGCGGNKKSEPPKQEQPIINNNPSDTGGSGKDKGKGGTGGSNTVQ